MLLNYFSHHMPDMFYKYFHHDKIHILLEYLNENNTLLKYKFPDQKIYKVLETHTKSKELYKFSKSVVMQDFIQKKRMYKECFDTLEDDKIKAIELYRNLLCKKVFTFKDLKDKVFKLAMQYPYLEEGLKAMVFFFFMLNKMGTDDLLGVINMFYNWVNYFSHETFTMFILEEMQKFLLTLQVSEGNTDYIDICDRIANDLTRLMPGHKAIELLKNKRLLNKLQVIDNCIYACQLQFAQSELIKMIDTPGMSKYIKIKCLKRLRSIYKFFGIGELVNECSEKLALLK